MATSPRNKPTTAYPFPHSTPAAAFPTASAYSTAPPSFYPTFYQQQPHPPTAHYTPLPPRGFTSTFLCRFVAAIAAVFTVIALISFITWLALNPKLPEFQVVSASVSSLNATDSVLSAKWDITLAATNPNKKLKLYYDSVSAGLFYAGNRFLAYTRYPPLSQDRRSENNVNVKFEVAEEFIGDDVAMSIAGDKARGSIQFGVKLSAWLRFKSGFVRSRYHLWEVVCYPLKFDFSSNNNGTGTMTRAITCD